jgi:hypothetical protein
MGAPTSLLNVKKEEFEGHFLANFQNEGPHQFKTKPETSGSNVEAINVDSPKT